MKDKGMIAGELICVIRLNKKEKDELDGRGIAEWIVGRKLEEGINFFFLLTTIVVVL